MKQTILTGLRANNDLHIGNYFGAMLPIIDTARTKADQYEVNMFIPDLHSFTTPIDHSKLHGQIIDNARKFIAAGLPLDHDSIHIYRQSYIPAHSELTWILDCFTSFGEMRRMTQFKDKQVDLYNQAGTGSFDAHLNESMAVDWEKVDEDTLQKFNASVTVGLFNYPVLMAADILLYGASYVPVGDDQTQHLEYARNIAGRMNNRFGELFIVPEPVSKQHEFFGNDQGLRIKDLQNPLKKMSKSADNDKGGIFLSDEPDKVTKKIMAAETDSVGVIHFDWEKQPGITNLLQILALVSGRDQAHVNAEWEGKQRYGDLKKVVAEHVAEFLTNYQKIYRLIDNEALQAKLQKSEVIMNERANTTLLQVQQAIGLRPIG